MPKLLLVEDDPFIAEIYKKKFEGSGFEVLNATSGKQVLRELLEKQFDIVLLDLVLPEMGGFDILHELRTSGKYPPDLKVVIFSNLSGSEEREKAVKYGANGFISKTDFTPSKVVEEVNRYLRQFSEQKKNDDRRNGEAAEASPVEPQLKKKILIIEDEAVFTEMFSRRLSDEGYEVKTIDNGYAGVEEALKNIYDLIITDAVIPGLLGKEVIERLKSSDVTKNIPIFLISASLDEMEFKEASDAGAQKAFLKTQITPSELAYEVNALFREAEK